MLKARFHAPFRAERFDISSDGAYVRAMGPTQELSVFAIGGESIGALLTVPETLKGLSFSSSSVLYSWDTKGIFNHFPFIGQELKKIPTSDRSNALFLTGHDDGSMVLTRLPAFEYQPSSSSSSSSSSSPSLNRIVAHNGSLSSLAFVEDDAKLITQGANDGLFIVWRVTYDAEEAEIELPPAAEGEGDESKEKEEEEEGNDPDKPKIAAIIDFDDDEDLKDGPERMTEHLTRRKGATPVDTISLFGPDVGINDASTLSVNAVVVAEKVQLLRESLVDFNNTATTTTTGNALKRLQARKAAEKKRKEAIQGIYIYIYIYI